MEDEKQEAKEIFKIFKDIKYKKEEFTVKIVNENRQLAVRLPQKVVEYLNISPNKYNFKFILNEKERTLQGELIKSEEKS